MPSPIQKINSPSSLPDEDWGKIEKELPVHDEAALLHFLSGRNSLISLEKQRRSDYTFRQTLSPLAQRACELVDQIRDEEQRTVWASEAKATLCLESAVKHFPGMAFSLAKERMEKTKLWQIVKRMPKGALLHAHLDAMVDLDFLFDVLLSMPGMHIYCAVPLSNTTELEKASVRFKFVKSVDNEANQNHSIWNTDYIPFTPVPVTIAADSFPHGGRPAFLAWLRDRCTITECESIEHYRGVDEIWMKFSSVFLILDTIIFYEPIFRLCLQRIMAQLLADGVRWVDLRLAFTFHYYREGHEEAEPDFGRLFYVFGQELEKFQASEEGKGFWGSRIIWTSLRSLETRKIVEDMEACIAIKIAYPQLISGYDLVGQEDAGRTLKDLLPELFWFKSQCAKECIDIPYFFHAGECLGDGNETDLNLFDAILLGTRRIGHGFSLYKHPLLINLVKEKKILVESCPISNEVLRLCSSIKSHPLPALIACGVPCSLSNDDPTILGQDSIGLTHDFWQALQGWNNLGLAGLASLAENSVRWAAFEDEKSEAWIQGIQEGYLGSSKRAIHLNQWHIEWEQFCLWVVTEFGTSQPEIEADAVATSDAIR
ncbi:Adenosine deaminase 2 [Golovinomyces cichoracearum]|uniref:adenosine deaminase n=1 Tax=Golovinomyces cichoracearum TaxID=62708 RepID=A0A420ITJ0_9PEZI|nr:Adenosine deaminase 2 [Golovinomyces cichoracearum]